MDSTTIPFTLQLPTTLPFAFSVQALHERLQTLTDARKPRGVRSPLDVLVLVAVLARLSATANCNRWRTGHACAPTAWPTSSA